MSDDIVTRLREKYQGQLPICAEAADEIETLRYDRRWLLHHIAMLKCNDKICQEMIDIEQPYLQLLKDTVAREQSE